LVSFQTFKRYWRAGIDFLQYWAYQNNIRRVWVWFTFSTQCISSGWRKPFSLWRDDIKFNIIVNIINIIGWHMEIICIKMDILTFYQMLQKCFNCVWKSTFQKKWMSRNFLQIIWRCLSFSVQNWKLVSDIVAKVLQDMAIMVPLGI